jgi:hypothetical protein
LGFDGAIRMRHFVFFLLTLFFLVGCEAQATPIALVAEPTGDIVEASPVATNPPNLIYGLFSNTEGYVVDLAEIQSRALVETFYDSNRYVDYDIVAAYGVFEGWQLSPIRQHLALVINPNLAPLDNEAIRVLIPQAIDSQALVDSLAIAGMQAGSLATLPNASIRTSLANAGYPDGFQLTLAASPLLGLGIITEQFNANNISIQVIEADTIIDNRAHLLLVLWTDEAERDEWVSQMGEADVLEIYSLPISYLVKDGIHIEFSEAGWPLPSR